MICKRSFHDYIYYISTFLLCGNLTEKVNVATYVCLDNCSGKVYHFKINAVLVYNKINVVFLCIYT